MGGLEHISVQMKSIVGGATAKGGGAESCDHKVFNSACLLKQY